MPKGRVIQIEELDNGWVVREFDAERTSTYHLVLDRALAHIRGALTGPRIEEPHTASTLVPIVRTSEPPTALERKNPPKTKTKTSDLLPTADTTRPPPRWRRPDLPGGPGDMTRRM